MALPLILALSVPAHASAAANSHAKYQGVLPDAYYDQLARCETGGNWQQWLTYLDQRLFANYCHDIIDASRTEKLFCFTKAWSSERQFLMIYILIWRYY